VFTHAYEGRKGIRYLNKGLKVYHIPTWIVYNQTSFPTGYSLFHWMRSVWIREDIEIIHAHQVL
jgi:phosphatidylinositol glycan class A protein